MGGVTKLHVLEYLYSGVSVSVCGCVYDVDTQAECEVHTMESRTACC